MPRSADELDRRIRDLEAERLRPVPKPFTNRAHSVGYDAFVSAAFAHNPLPCDPQDDAVILPPESESERAARIASLLAEFEGEEAD